MIEMQVNLKVRLTPFRADGEPPAERPGALNLSLRTNWEWSIGKGPTPQGSPPGPRTIVKQAHVGDLDVDQLPGRALVVARQGDAAGPVRLEISTKATHQHLWRVVYRRQTRTLAQSSGFPFVVREPMGNADQILLQHRISPVDPWGTLAEVRATWDAGASHRDMQVQVPTPSSPADVTVSRLRRMLQDYFEDGTKSRDQLTYTLAALAHAPENNTEKPVTAVLNAAKIEPPKRSYMDADRLVNKLVAEALHGFDARDFAGVAVRDYVLKLAGLRADAHTLSQGRELAKALVANGLLPLGLVQYMRNEFTKLESTGGRQG